MKVGCGLEREREIVPAADSRAAIPPHDALVLPLAGAAAQSTEISPKGGLFFKIDQPVVYYKAPLVDTDVQLAVAGTMLRATLRQHCVNRSNARLEGVYVFPLPQQSARSRLGPWLDDRPCQAADERR